MSQTYPAAPAGKCLNFYYHMYGSDINVLHVIVKPIGAPFGTNVWNKTGNQGDIWRHGQATIQATSKFQVCLTDDDRVDVGSTDLGSLRKDQPMHPCRIPSLTSINAHFFSKDLL